MRAARTDLDAVGAHERQDDGDGVGVARFAVGLEGVGEDLVVLGLDGVAGDALAERFELAEGPAADIGIGVLACLDERGDGVVAEDLGATGDVGAEDTAGGAGPGDHLAQGRGGRDVGGGGDQRGDVESAEGRGAVDVSVAGERLREVIARGISGATGAHRIVERGVVDLAEGGELADDRRLGVGTERFDRAHRGLTRGGIRRIEERELGVELGVAHADRRGHERHLRRRHRGRAGIVVDRRRLRGSGSERPRQERERERVDRAHGGHSTMANSGYSPV